MTETVKTGDGLPLSVPTGLADERVVFLDYDGVLTSDRSGTSVACILAMDGGSGAARQKFLYAPDPVCIGRLKRMLDATGSVVVVASNWRRFPPKGTWNGFLNPLGRLLEDVGDRVLGCLPFVHGETKAESLSRFMSMNPDWCGDFAILEDDPEEGYAEHGFSSRLVLTDRDTGLSDADADMAKAMLGAS